MKTNYLPNQRSAKKHAFSFVLLPDFQPTRWFSPAEMHTIFRFVLLFVLLGVGVYSHSVHRDNKEVHQNK